VNISTGLSINQNRLCSLPDSIEAWIDTSSYDQNWRETQRLDDTHYCDGTGNIEPVIQAPVNDITIQHNPFSNSLTLTFPNSSDQKEVSIYTIKGALVKKLSTSQDRLMVKTDELNEGVYFLQVELSDRIINYRFMKL
jgi:hypothetical protein